MKKTIFLITLIISSFAAAIAQEDFTYISDRKFFMPNDLIGYDFRPNFMEIPNETEEELSPGEYSFGITRSNLYVDGGDLKGVYSVNNINPTEYGYKLVLMNARDPRIQGHLKVILNKRAQVEALVFKKSNDEPEIIFFQSPMPERLGKKEEIYFTDRYETSMEETDSIWGLKLIPFMRIHNDEGGVQERLQIADSTSIEFVEKITVIEKKKKVKKGRKGKKDKKNKEEEEIADEVVAESEEIETTEEEIVEETTEEEIEATELEIEEIPEVDPGAFPPVEEAENMEAALEEDQKENVKVKIVKEYFLNIRTILTYNDGRVEDLVEEIPIKKKFSLFETENAGNDPTIAPFELEVYPEKGKPIIIYLTKRKTVSAIQVKGKKYLMRGH